MAQHDAGLVQDALDGQRFQPAGVGEQVAGLRRSAAFSPGCGLLARPLVGLAEQGERVLGDLAGLPRVGVLLDEDVERALAQLRQHAGRVAEPHRQFAGREQLFEQVIDRVVARGARQHASRRARPPGG